MKKTIVVAATGASGMPLLIQCLRLIREQPEFSTLLILSRSAQLTLEQETGWTVEQLSRLADETLDVDAIGERPASGSFPTQGMLVVPCSMKTVAGICSGYSDNLILRAADVTIKEQRPLVLAVRETPLSAIHLKNLYTLSLLPGVRLIPPMMTFYQRPSTLEEMTYAVAARLVAPFGVTAKEFKPWNGL